MSFEPKRLDVLCLTKVIKQKLQEKEPDMDYLEDLLSRLPPDTNQLTLESLLNDSLLTDDQFLNCLNLHLDEKTKHFVLMHELKCPNTIIPVMQMLTKLSPNIKRISLSRILFQTEVKDELIKFLKNCKNLEALHVSCDPYKCALSKLLIEEGVEQLDEDVRIGLEKIDYIKFTMSFKPEDFTKLVNRLPNLKMFLVNSFSFGNLFSDYFDKCTSFNRTFDLNIIYDKETSLQRLEIFAKVFPKIENISIILPEDNVVENLWKFPLLTGFTLYKFDSKELLKLLNTCGKNIKIMTLYNSDEPISDKTLYDLCPELEKLINM